MIRKLLSAFILTVLLVTSSVYCISAKPDNPSQSGNIEKVVFVHYSASAKPASAAASKILDDAYKTFRGGIRWPGENPEVSYLINTDSVPGAIDDNAAAAEIAAAFETWDSETGAELFNNSWGSTSKTGAVLDGENIVSWTDLETSGTIAVCTFWFDTSAKTISEFDIQFNSYYNWGIGDSNEIMDIRNIATHEIGHTLILKDLYRDQLSEMTMYGYSDYGETKKRTLENGDISGLQELYGS